VELQLYAKPVPEGLEEAAFSQDMLFVTEAGQCSLPVRATVLTEAEFERRRQEKTGSVARGKAVRLLSTRPPKSSALV